MLDDREPDRRALGVRLDHERVAAQQARVERAAGHAGLEQHPVRRGQRLALEHALRHRLVHRERAREHARAGVDLAGQLESGLDRAVLAVRAVQGDEHHVRVADRRRLHRREHRLERQRAHGRERPCSVALAARGQHLAIRGVDRRRLVPEIAQRLRDPTARAERHLALGGSSAHQDGDFHALLSPHDGRRRRKTRDAGRAADQFRDDGQFGSVRATGEGGADRLEQRLALDAE